MSSPRGKKPIDDFLSHSPPRDEALDSKTPDMELKSPRSARGQQKAKEKLAQFGEEIWQKGVGASKEGKGFKTVGFGTPIYKGERWVDVPQGAADAYAETIAATTRGRGEKEPFAALVSFIAKMRYAEEKPQDVRDPDTQAFYAHYARMTGAELFGTGSREAEQFDAEVENELGAIRMKNADPALEKFQHDMMIEQKNLDDVKAKLQIVLDEVRATLSTPTDRVNFQAAEKLLADTLNRILTAYTKADIDLYKKDYIRVLHEIYPKDDPNLRKLITAVNDFCNHHTKMLTDLDSRYNALYLDAFMQAISIAAQPVVGAVVPALPSSVPSATLGAVTTDRLGGAAGLAIGSQTRDLETLSGDTPISPVSHKETSAERAQRYAKTAMADETKLKVALAATTITLTIAGGPVGAAIAIGLGVTSGAIMSGAKVVKTYNKINTLEEFSANQRKTHEAQFCDFRLKQVGEIRNEKDPEVRTRLRAYLAGEAKKTMEMSDLSPRSSSAKVMGKLGDMPSPPASPTAAASPKSTSAMPTSSSVDERFLNPKPEQKAEEATELQPIRPRRR